MQAMALLPARGTPLALLAALSCLSLSSAFLATPTARLPTARLGFSPRVTHLRAPRTAPAAPRRAMLGRLSMADEVKSGIGMKYQCDDGTELVYDFVPASNPTVMYLPGLNQTRYDTKFNALQSWCKRNNYGYMTADYFGCGQSGGEFKDGSISRWTRDTLTLLKNVVKTPVILVGSGVGGWVMLQVALQNPSQVKGLVGIAADPDFTTDVVLPKLTDATMKEIEDTGFATIPWGNSKYMISKALIDDAEKNLLLQKGEQSIDIQCPVRLLQGLGDEEIPPDRALKLCNALKSQDVVVTYVKDGNHVLDSEEDFRLITADVKELAEKFFEYDLTSPTSG